MHRHLPFPSTLRTNAKIAQLKTLLLTIIAKRRRQRLAQQALREAKAADGSSDSDGDGGDLLVDYLLDAREARDGSAGSSPPSEKRAGSSSSGARAFNDDQVMDHAITFALAGHETTSQALCWTMMLLCRHPEWKARVRAQVLAVCGRDRAPTYEDAAQMPLLNMVLQESMRLYPPVPFIVRTAARAVVLGPTPTGATLNIAAGTSIVIPIAGIHRDPELYPDPDVFNPLRFEHGISKACPHPFGYLPFSHGIRNCIGAQFALMEARLVLARLLQRLDFELDPSYVHQPSPFITLRPGHGMPLRVWSLPVDIAGVTGVTPSGEGASDSSRTMGGGAGATTD
jgi:cytochrome P450